LTGTRVAAIFPGSVTGFTDIALKQYAIVVGYFENAAGSLIPVAGEHESPTKLDAGEET